VAGWLREHGLSVVLVSVFAACMVAQVLAGQQQHNEERGQHGEAPVSMREYLSTGHFWEATAENWESEFLQMAAYVLLTAGLYQRGSSESKNPDKAESVDRDPRNVRGKARAEAPWPVRRGGWVLKLYEHSLSLAFVALFVTSFWLHAAGGARAHNAEELLHGGPPVTVFQYMATAQFWFESFQNWQSEFLALVAMVILSIWLRQRGSPESKPVDAPHSATGSTS
jgi:membrane protein implicated in regulation of membrane protease activity